MCRIPQRGWSGPPDREERAREDDDPRGVFVSPARTVDSSRGCRPAEDTGAVRKSPGPPPPLHGMMNDRWAGMFSSLAEPRESHCPPPRPFLTLPRVLQGREGRASRRGVVPPGQVWVLSCILRSTSSRLKLAAFWRCGYSLNVCRNSPTKACAGTSRKT